MVIQIGWSPMNRSFVTRTQHSITTLAEYLIGGPLHGACSCFSFLSSHVTQNYNLFFQCLRSRITSRQKFLSTQSKNKYQRLTNIRKKYMGVKIQKKINIIFLLDLRRGWVHVIANKKTASLLSHLTKLQCISKKKGAFCCQAAGSAWHQSL